MHTSFENTDQPDDVSSASAFLDEEAVACRVKSDSEQSNQARHVGQKETCVLRWMKRLVIFILIAAAAAVVALAFQYTSANQDEKFHEHYENEAKRLVAYFHQQLVTQVWIGASASISFTSTSALGALNPMFKFPTISDPGFELSGFGSTQVNAISAIAFGPLLNQTTLPYWENFQANVVDLFLSGVDFGWSNRTHHDGVFELTNETSEPVPVSNVTNRTFNPVWQIYPSFGRRKIQYFDQFSETIRGHALSTMMLLRSPVYSAILSDETERIFDDHYDSGRQRSLIYTPVFDLKNSTDPVGTIAVEIEWMSLFEGATQDTNAALHVVLENTCGDVMTFELSNDSVTLVGKGDLHDNFFDELARNSSTKTVAAQVVKMVKGGKSLPPPEYQQLFARLLGSKKSLEFEEWPEGFCAFRVRVYPTAQFRASYTSDGPMIYSMVIVACFAFTVLVFITYDMVVERRQRKVMATAVRSRSIVDSLFPSIVRDRMFEIDGPYHRRRSMESDKSANSPGLLARASPRNRLATWMKGNHNRDEQPPADQEPIAEVFLDTTVIFADIAGFTAWSSEREPHQVFMLLEALYEGFDTIAKRLGVFKVETIGDCYVAVTGLPDENKDHAITMARFASECVSFTNSKTQELEVTLGPGTSDLRIRIGMHSGPVTAGVLRGDKSRFQLFGVTVNTAARMESLGLPSAIQVSQATADLITNAGKAHWLTARDGFIDAKGKGQMQTYWCQPNRRRMDIARDFDCNNEPENRISIIPGKPRRRHSSAWQDLNVDHPFGEDTPATKRERLIDWNTEILLNLLAKVNASNHERLPKVNLDGSGSTLSTWTNSARTVGDMIDSYVEGASAEVINFAPYRSPGVSKGSTTTDTQPLDDQVRFQMRMYVAQIASLYRDDNAFHNFEHASHVALSANKLMKRIISPDESTINAKAASHRRRSAKLHASTFGISSDPLAQFCIVLGALVHDVDHAGVPNAVLVKEGSPLARMYNNKSVAEQNSIRVALQLLEDDAYSDLRACICVDHCEEQYARFRQLLVNIVLATDIVDSDLQQARKDLWNKAFYDPDRVPYDNNMLFAFCRPDEQYVVNRKATIVIDHIIQASDVAHTMQHWHVYCKWNRKLFEEAHAAYAAGRTEENPLTYWYNGEIDFFDNYSLPLAHKLQECGVFGVSGDEYLQYALQNREEWVIKGKSIVAELMGEMSDAVIEEV